MTNSNLEVLKSGAIHSFVAFEPRSALQVSIAGLAKAGIAATLE